VDQETRHISLRSGDRDDRRFDSIVLVDGYVLLCMGRRTAVAVTAYMPPGSPPLIPPMSAPGDFINVQYMVAAADERTEELLWMVDVSYDLEPDAAYLLGGRVDGFVAKQMRLVDLVVVIDVTTAEAWTTDNIRLILPNDREMWSLWS
jgi:hypothetical protein